jgi:tetratricopeptide (TPR) repeat protein
MEIDYNDEFKKLYDNSDKKDDNELYEKGKIFQKSIRCLDVNNQINLFYFLAFYASKLGNEKEAIEYCDNGIEIISKEKARTKTLNNYTTILRELYFQKGISLSRLADNDESLFLEAEKAFDEYVRLSIRNATRGIGVRGNYYSFRKINDFTFQDLKQNKITVSNPAKFNDPFDCLFYHFIKEKKDSSFDNRALIKSFEKIRIRCFVSESFLNRSTLQYENRKTKPVIDVLMWSHYADSHKGICVLYNFEFGVSQSSRDVSSCFFKVNYFKDEIVDIGKDTKIGFEDGFLKKNKCWGYEDEVPLLYFDPNCDTDFIYLPLDGAKVSAIYFGLYCPPEHVDMVKKIFENTGVRFYKMKTDPTNIYNLIPEECSK